MVSFSRQTLTAVLLSSLAWYSVAVDGNCTDSKLESCDELNRMCETELCGPCVADYIGFDIDTLNEYGKLDDAQYSSCLRIASIDVTKLQEFFDTFGVAYKARTDGYGLTDEERIVLLVKVARYISEWNNQIPPPPYQLSLNKFSADSEEDAADRRGYKFINVTGTDQELPRVNTQTSFSDPETVPTIAQKIDWVAEGAVTYVKDQGRCGSCWAVSLVGSIEGAAAVHAIRNGYDFLNSLSFQQFISCDKSNNGCDGGNLYYGMAYAVENQFGGVARLADYEYSDKDGDTTTSCQVDDKELVVTADTGNMLDYNDNYNFEERLEIFKKALNERGPISMVIRSNCKTISNYRKGVMTDDGDCACSFPSCIDHAVLMVGYDDTADIPYMKLKNSWGTDWGEDGYFRIAQTPANGRYGLFGMLAHGVVPLDVQNVTSQIFEEAPDDDDGLEWWAYLLIIVAGGCVLTCISCLIMSMMCDRKEQAYLQEEEDQA